MPHITQQLQQNLDQINTRISEACKRAGRSTDEVKLIAVTKYAQTAWIEGLLELGYFKWGESRPQQLLERVELFANQTDQIQWHMIGQLQRNKVRKLLPAVSLIHSVDSLKLLLAIDRIAQEEQQQPQVLLQVNTSEEAAKQVSQVDGTTAATKRVSTSTTTERVASAKRIGSRPRGRPEPVVLLTFAVITQNVVIFLNFLEVLGRFLVVLVFFWVVFHRQLAMRLADFICGRRAGNS